MKNSSIIFIVRFGLGFSDVSPNTPRSFFEKVAATYCVCVRDTRVIRNLKHLLCKHIIVKNQIN